MPPEGIGQGGGYVYGGGKCSTQGRNIYVFFFKEMNLYRSMLVGRKQLAGGTLVEGSVSDEEIYVKTLYMKSNHE